MARENLKKARRKAGMTQQKMADKLEIGLRQYQRMEEGQSRGSFESWDALEDILGIHQRKLREISKIHLSQEESRRGRPKSQKEQSRKYREVQ